MLPFLTLFKIGKGLISKGIRGIKRKKQRKKDRKNGTSSRMSTNDNPIVLDEVTIKQDKNFQPPKIDIGDYITLPKAEVDHVAPKNSVAVIFGAIAALIAGLYLVFKKK